MILKPVSLGPSIFQQILPCSLRSAQVAQGPSIAKETQKDVQGVMKPV